VIECLLPSFDGTDVPDWVRRLIAEGLGGVVLFGSNIRDREQLAELTRELRAENDRLLIALDEEGGDVTRLHAAEGSPYPGNAALGAVDDVELTERVAASIGAELAAVGVDLDFAPVADVNVDPANPVIGVRSFGADPDLVARHVAAYVTGLQSAGVAGCAKHFPGHGATNRDSHLELATIAGDVADGLPPFRAAIDAGVQSIMTAHVRVPALGDDPATVNPRVLALLREELGYDGLVISDALEMKGLSDTVRVDEGAARALGAGVDALIVGRDLGEEAVARVRDAIAARVPEGRLASVCAVSRSGRAPRVRQLPTRARAGRQRGGRFTWRATSPSTDRRRSSSSRPSRTSPRASTRTH
jgi:beta-N-acetylhexosaminidase